MLYFIESVKKPLSHAQFDAVDSVVVSPLQGINSNCCQRIVRLRCFTDYNRSPQIEKPG